MKTVLTLLLVVLVSFGIGYTQEHHGHNQHEEADAVSQANPISEDLGICPVMGGKANKESSYYYEGKTYYFCCPGCISKFKEDPEKYIAKKKEFNLEAYQYGFEPEEIVELYRKRMWTEAMFRDLKSRKWGMGLDEVQLTTVERTQRHFLIIMLAYILLCAFGAIAEHQQFGETLKANTVNKRVLSLAVIGNHFIEFIGRITVRMAIEKLVQLPT